METAGRIDDNDITKMASRIRNGIFRDGNGILAAFFRIDGNIQFASQHLQLFNGGGPVHVTGREQGTLAPADERLRQLGGGRLAGALQACEHDYRRRPRRNAYAALRTAQQLGQLVADNFDNRLRCVQAAEYFFTDSLFSDLLYKIFRYGKINIRFQKSPTHLFQRLAYVLFRQLALAAKLPECRLKSFGKTFEWHVKPSFDCLYIQPCQYAFRFFYVLCAALVQAQQGMLHFRPYPFRPFGYMELRFIMLQSL